MEGRPLKDALLTFLMAYQSTPHASTGVTPYYLMFGREMRTKLLELVSKSNGVLENEGVREKDWNSEVKGAADADDKRHAVESSIVVGDSVLVKESKVYKLSPTFNPVPMVVEKNGNEVMLRRSDGVLVKRNSSFVKKYTSSSEEPQVVAPEEPADATSVRPQRACTLPSHLTDYVMD